MAECPTCHGSGVVCIDDICRGSGECIHGDGWCPTCGGMPEDYEDDGPDDFDDDEDLDLDEVLDCGSRYHPGCSKCEVKP